MHRPTNPNTHTHANNTSSSPPPPPPTHTLKIHPPNTHTQTIHLLPTHTHNTPSSQHTHTIHPPPNTHTHTHTEILTVLYQFMQALTLCQSSTPYNSTYQMLKLKLGPQAWIGTETNTNSHLVLNVRGPGSALQQKTNKHTTVTSFTAMLCKC